MKRFTLASAPCARTARASVVLAFALLLTDGALAGPYTDGGLHPNSMSAWATAVDSIVRGPVDYADPGQGNASAGDGAFALGPSVADSADTVSLGDSGSATLYFDSGVGNGPGDDFAVFENGFDTPNGLFAELAYVEVSSDGLIFARFDSDALNPFPVYSFDTLDPTEYDGFAGRHQIGLGTGFDLQGLASDPAVTNGSVNLWNVRYVRVVDVIGDGSTLDSNNNPIYDPYATAFASGGFDLEAIGVVHVPESNLHLGMLIGLLGLVFVAPRRRRSTRSARSSNAARTPRAHADANANRPNAFTVGLYAIGIGLGLTGGASALTADFEDQGLGPNSYLNGSTAGGSFNSDGALFENNYNATYDSFTGYAISTMTDATTPGYGNQFSAYVGSGAGGSATYAIAYLTGSITLASETIVAGAEFTNTTYAGLSMLNGDSFAKKFGGSTGNDPDFFRLLIEGFDGLGASTGSVELMLADYRFANNAQDYILDAWTFLDLSGLGAVKELRFGFESSDVGQFGINTPTYFAIDNLTTVPEPGSALLLGFGLLGLARRNRTTRRESSGSHDSRELCPAG